MNFHINKSLVASVVASCLLFVPIHQVNAGNKYMWNLSKIGVTKTLHRTAKKRGTNVKIGVLDSLVYCSHKELKGRCTATISSAGTYTKYGDHGTHVATTIAAKRTGSGGMVGVAPNVKIYAYAYFDDNGSLGSTVEAAMIDHARKKGVRVINMSYGPSTKGKLAHFTALRQMGETKNKYVVFVKSAGNDGVKLSNLVFNDNFSAQKKLKNLIIVGAVDKNLKRTSWSNRPGHGCFKAVNDRTCKKKNKYKYFFVVAPGQSIYAGIANGGYASKNGTSMAAPHVTGVVALLQRYWPVLKKRTGSVANIIFHTAQDLGAKGVDPIYGWGLVRANKAMSPLGRKYLRKTNKVYSLSSSKLRVSHALAALTPESISFFDKYDRDFQIPLATFAPSYSGTLDRWMKVEDSRSHSSQKFEDGLSFIVDSEQYNPNDPSLSDIPFHLSYRAEEGLAWHFGQGNATDRLESPESLMFGLMGEDNSLSGAYPVLSIAEGGTYGLYKQPLEQGFSLTSGVLSNTRLDSNDEDRGYAPKANALVLSLGRISENRKLSGHITATYLTEEDGVLGTGGVGGLHFTDGFDSNAMTVGTQYRMPSDYRLSASYTTAFSQGDTVSDGLLSLESNRLISTAFAVGLEKQKLATNNDHLKFSISQPLRVDSGSMTLTHDDYYDEDGVLHSRTAGIDLGQSGRQIDYQLQYTRPLTKNRNLGLFVYYAQDYLHQAHQDDYGIGIRLKGTY